MKFTTYLLTFATASLLLFSCEKEESHNSTPVESPDALVLNQGGAQGSNNAGIGALNQSTGAIDNNWFFNANHRNLGSTGQDMIVYGSKAYVTVTFSNSLEVVNSLTGVSQRIDMGDHAPRYIAADGGKIYVTCYNPCSVVRIDTATLEIEATCTLGQFHPEGIAIAQGKAFVASQVTPDYSRYDSVVYVVDLATFANPTTVNVGYNVDQVRKLDENKILVSYIGNYSTIPSGSAIIDVQTLSVTQTGQPMKNMDIWNGRAYSYAVSYDAYYNETAEYFVLEGDGSVSPFPFTVSGIANNTYGINIDPVNGDIYILSSDYQTNGRLYCFSQEGIKRFETATGINPCKVVFL